ncbi:hypothetical protein IAQ61_006212 [Plenodomus lingam]|uniref:uncharacterized protein n=1 Tax=Leptosphaeria maculans TaxID=5022 RepID=UPI0033265011|nr:hypothetical protein IAQ61_006212 [Plenodomus lingam]
MAAARIAAQQSTAQRNVDGRIGIGVLSTLAPASTPTSPFHTPHFLNLFICFKPCSHISTLSKSSSPRTAITTLDTRYPPRNPMPQQPSQESAPTPPPQRHTFQPDTRQRESEYEYREFGTCGFAPTQPLRQGPERA